MHLISFEKGLIVLNNANKTLIPFVIWIIWIHMSNLNIKNVYTQKAIIYFYILRPKNKFN
jgi:hypothetical protein